MGFWVSGFRFRIQRFRVLGFKVEIRVLDLEFAEHFNVSKIGMKDLLSPVVITALTS